MGSRILSGHSGVSMNVNGYLLIFGHNIFTCTHSRRRVRRAYAIVVLRTGVPNTLCTTCHSCLFVAQQSKPVTIGAGLPVPGDSVYWRQLEEQANDFFGTFWHMSHNNILS